MDTPVELAAVLASAVPEVVEEWGVWNDPEFFEPRFASGEIHPALREKLLGEPLWTSPLPGPAKRFMMWTNDQRSLQGTFVKEGFAVLRMRTITPSSWRTVEGTELAGIDEGRRASK